MTKTPEEYEAIIADQRDHITRLKAEIERQSTIIVRQNQGASYTRIPAWAPTVQVVINGEPVETPVIQSAVDAREYASRLKAEIDDIIQRARALSDQDY